MGGKFDASGEYSQTFKEGDHEYKVPRRPPVDLEPDHKLTYDLQNTVKKSKLEDE